MKPGHTDKGHKGGKRSRGPQVGAALSLDKFASAKVSKYDKKQLLEKQRALRAKQINKYRKLQKRLAAEGKLSPLAADAAMDGYKEPPRASTSGVTEAEELDSMTMQRHRPTAHEDAAARPGKKQRTQQPHERAGGERQLPEPPHAADHPYPAQHKQPQQQQKQQQQQQQQQQQEQQEQQQHERHEDAGPSTAVEGRRKHKQQRPPSQLQRLADKRQRELTEQRQAHEQRLKAQEELKEKKQAKQKERSASKHNFFKRTKHGQPLMKYRVDKVLQVLQREVAGKP